MEPFGKLFRWRADAQVPQGTAICSITTRTNISVTAISQTLHAPSGIQPGAHSVVGRTVRGLKCIPDKDTRKLTTRGAKDLKLFLPGISRLSAVRSFGPRGRSTTALRLSPPSREPRTGSLCLSRILQNYRLRS